MPELLVTVSLRFPTLDRQALAEHLAPVMQAAVAAGGVTTNVSIQEYEPEEEDR
jgi:hypothetical protein